MNEACRAGRGTDLFEFRRLLVSGVTEGHGTGDQWFRAVMVIVLVFQVAAVNASEEPPNLNQRTIGMEGISSVLIGRFGCMRIQAVQEVEAVVVMRACSPK